jgi:indole-3-glycerol phosphate synthase
MPSILQKICDVKKEHVAAKQALNSLSRLKDMAASAEETKPFLNALKDTAANKQVALIAEVKKASPSKGIIREEFDPVLIAKSYHDAGATCLSVLTDQPYFQGKDEYLQDVRQAVPLPLLRKDFMVSPYQIYESRALGADCVLLIMAALELDLAKELYDIAKELSMDVLVETHDESDMEKAIKLNADMIGINSRNLKTMDVSLDNAIRLRHSIATDTFTVAESGIAGHNTVMQLQNEGFQAFLVGESLMRENDIGAATRALLGLA